MTGRAKAVVLAMPLAALAQWVILSFRVPVIHSLPGWTHEFVDGPLTHGWLFVVLCALAMAVAAIVLRSPSRSVRNLCLIMAFGYVLQSSLVLMLGRGMEPFRGQLESLRGNSVRAASGGRSMWEVVTRYEPLMLNGDIGITAVNKPPGHLLVYMLMQKCSNLVAPQAGETGRSERLTLFIFVVWPLLTFSCVFPLYHFCRLVMDARQAAIACLVYVCVPNVAARQPMCLDLALYPSLCVASLYLVIWSYRRDSFAWAVSSGMAAFLVTFISFSLLPLYALAPLFAFTYHVLSGPTRAGWWRLGKLLLGWALGILALNVAFRLLLNYHIWDRFTYTMYRQAKFMDWRLTLDHVTYYFSLSHIEFWFFVGAPLALLFFADLARAARESLARRAHVLDGFCLCLFAVLIVLTLLSRGRNETSRYWLFLEPLLCMFAAREISRLWRDRSQWGVMAVMVMQLVTALLFIRWSFPC